MKLKPLGVGGSTSPREDRGRKGFLRRRSDVRRVLKKERGSAGWRRGEEGISG